MSPTVSNIPTTPQNVTPTYYPTFAPSVDVITTFAGTGAANFSGDNGQATAAAVNNPNGVTLDASGTPHHSMSLLSFLQILMVSLLGNVYFADSDNNRIRKVTVSTGIIITIAGNGTASYSGDNGEATNATLNSPYAATVDSSGNHLTTFYLLPLLLVHSLGNVYVADSFNSRIRLITASTGIITTYAGTGASSYSGDNGAATSAGLRSPYDVTLDDSGAALIVTSCGNLLSFSI